MSTLVGFFGRLNVFASAKLMSLVGGNSEMIHETFSNGIDGLLPPSLLLDYRVTIDYKTNLWDFENSFPKST